MPGAGVGPGDIAYRSRLSIGGGGGDIPASTDPYVVMDFANTDYTVDGVTTLLSEIWARIDQYDDSFDYDTEAANIVPGVGWQNSSSYPGLAPAIMTELAGGFSVRVSYQSSGDTGEAYFEAFNDDWTQDVGFGLDVGSAAYAIVFEGETQPATSNAGALPGVPVTGIFYVHPGAVGLSNCGDAFQSVVPPVTGVPPSFVMKTNNVAISKIEIFRGQLTQEQLDSLRDTSQVGISQSGKLVQSGSGHVTVGSTLAPDTEYQFIDDSGVDSHQWFKDGGALDGETGGSYEIPSDDSGHLYTLNGTKGNAELTYYGGVQSYRNDLTLPFELDTTAEPYVNSHAVFAAQNMATPWVLDGNTSGVFLSLDAMESLTAASSSGLTMLFEVDVTGLLSGPFWVELFQTDIDPATSHKRTLEVSISDQTCHLYFNLLDDQNNQVAIVNDTGYQARPSSDTMTIKAACSIAPDDTVKLLSNFSTGVISGNLGEAGFTGMFYQGGLFGHIGPLLKGTNMPSGATVTVKHIRLIEGPSSDGDMTAMVT